MKVLITGANGQLGKKIKDLSSNIDGFSFAFTDIDSLDISSWDVLNTFFEDNEFDFLINCAAYTAVDNAEDDFDAANLINTISPGWMALLCAKHGIKFIHISTDYVFDGEANIPYSEEAATNPKSVYGKTKMGGEQMVLEKNPESIIIRTSWLYSEYGSNFVKTILRLANEKEFLKVVNDQFGSPTYAGDLAAVIISIVKAASNKWKPGIYHYSNQAEISWFDFASKILEIMEVKIPIFQVASTEFPVKATRPMYSVLSTQKIIAEYNVEIPFWEDSLKLMLSRI